MPDIPNRTAAETVLSAALAATFRQYGGASPNFAAIEAETREKLAASLVVIYLLMLGQVDEQHEVGVGIAERQTLAANWATGRAAIVSRAMIDNMRAELDALRGANLKPEDFTPRVESIFSDTRAQSIAVTETTAAASAGEQAAAEIARAKSINLIAVWQTERDASVCRICSPLDRQPVEVWEREFPSGPPAHPNCRCFLEWVREEDLSVRT